MITRRDGSLTVNLKCSVNQPQFMVRSQLYYQPFLSHRILLLFLFSLQYRQCWLYEFFFCQNFFPYTHRHLFEGEKGNFSDKRKFILLILALLNNSRKFYNGSCCARQPYGVTKLTLDCLEVQMLLERKSAHIKAVCLYYLTSWFI